MGGGLSRNQAQIAQCSQWDVSVELQQKAGESLGFVETWFPPTDPSAGQKRAASVQALQRESIYHQRGKASPGFCYYFGRGQEERKGVEFKSGITRYNPSRLLRRHSQAMGAISVPAGVLRGSAPEGKILLFLFWSILMAEEYYELSKQDRNHLSPVQGPPAP